MFNPSVYTKIINPVIILDITGEIKRKHFERAFSLLKKRYIELEDIMPFYAVYFNVDISNFSVEIVSEDETIKRTLATFENLLETKRRYRKIERIGHIKNKLKSVDEEKLSIIEKLLRD